VSSRSWAQYTGRAASDTILFSNVTDSPVYKIPAPRANSSLASISYEILSILRTTRISSRYHLMRGKPARVARFIA
jgi:hypothetical protein